MQHLLPQWGRRRVSQRFKMHQRFIQSHTLWVTPGGHTLWGLWSHWPFGNGWGRCTGMCKMVDLGKVRHCTWPSSFTWRSNNKQQICCKPELEASLLWYLRAVSGALLGPNGKCSVTTPGYNVNSANSEGGGKYSPYQCVDSQMSLQAKESRDCALSASTVQLILTALQSVGSGENYMCKSVKVES
jgi:hypothetical protein